MLLTRMIFDMKNEKDASLALQFSYVMKMLFSTDKGWMLRGYLKENYFEELRYVLMTKAGKALIVEIGKNCPASGWSMSSYWDILLLSNFYTRPYTKGKILKESCNMLKEYDTFTYFT